MISAVIGLYLNVFIFVAQSFQKVPSLRALAPKQSEPPFLITQLVVLALFVALAVAATIKFHDAQVGTA